MFKQWVYILLLGYTYATFSIVATDSQTGEIGSAGGSCIANSIIISDIHPGVGAIHTQSYWLSVNQQYASTLMEEGYSPEEIISLLEENDAQNNPAIRQYGIADLGIENNYGMLYEQECNEIGNTQWYGNSGSNETALCTDIPYPRSASFTGENCSSWKGHINGIDYAIQGNILLNEDVLLNMENNFLLKNGPLDQKLMAALQGAKIPGADTRCLDEGISTLSAFIRVAKPTDTNEFYMDLNIPNVVPYYAQTGEWIDPVDTLQSKFDTWYENEFEYSLGDVNRDFIIDILDIINLLNIILNQEAIGIEYYLSDLNQDNTINIQDIILIVNIIIND